MQCDLMFSNFYGRIYCLKLFVFWGKVGQKISKLKNLIKKTEFNLKPFFFFSKKFKLLTYLNKIPVSTYVDEKNSRYIFKKNKIKNDESKKLVHLSIKVRSFQKKFKFNDKLYFLENLLEFFSIIRKISKNSIKILLTFFNLKVIYENLKKKIRLKL